MTTELSKPAPPLTSSGQIRETFLSGGLDRAAMLELAREGLAATRSFQQNGELVTIPDYPTRLKFQEYITNVTEGTPVRRQEIVSRKLTSDEELMQMLEKSKAFRRSV